MDIAYSNMWALPFTVSLAARYTEQTGGIMGALGFGRTGVKGAIVAASVAAALAFSTGSAAALNLTGTWLITEHCETGECPQPVTTLDFDLTQAEGSSLVTGTEKSEGPRCPPGSLGEKLAVEGNSVLEELDSLCGTLTGSSFEYFLPGPSEVHVGEHDELLLANKVEGVATVAADEKSFSGTYKRVFMSGQGNPYGGTITATQTTTPFGTGSSTTGGGNPTPTPTPTPTPVGPLVVKPTAKCVVPKLKGLTVAAAEKALTKAHCSVGKIKKSKSKHVKKGRVISGNDAAGRSLPAGTKVILVVSKGA